MKALVTGAAGFIGSHSDEHAARPRRADVVGVDCFTDYYPRAIKEAQPRRGARPAADSGSSKTRSRRPISPALLDGVTHVFHLAAQAGVRRSWGTDFQVYTVNNIDATQRLLEACVGRPIERFVYASSSSVYGDASRFPMREDALPSRSRPTA